MNFKVSFFCFTLIKNTFSKLLNLLNNILIIMTIVMKNLYESYYFTYMSFHFNIELTVLIDKLVSLIRWPMSKSMRRT